MPLWIVTASRSSSAIRSRCGVPLADTWRRDRNRKAVEVTQEHAAASRRHKPTRAKQLGVTDDEYQRMFAVQQGVCVICGNPPKKRRLHVDHDHRTGTVRGLLCFRCNRALPNYVTADWLLRAYAYVNRNGEADVPDQWASLRSLDPALADEHRDSPGDRVTVREHA